MKVEFDNVELVWSEVTNKIYIAVRDMREKDNFVALHKKDVMLDVFTAIASLPMFRDNFVVVTVKDGKKFIIMVDEVKE